MTKPNQTTAPTTDPNDKDERYRRVWDVVSGIPSGCVLNYGEIARLAGLPGRARMVGRALGLAPCSIQLPWHRVVNAQGRISFKPGGAKYRRQRELLEAEGVQFEGESIDLERYAPSAALDRMLWGP